MPGNRELIERGSQARLRLAHASVAPNSVYEEALAWMREAADALERAERDQLASNPGALNPPPPALGGE